MLWAISVHLDKYLVERFFKDSNVALMVVFTALLHVGTGTRSQRTAPGGGPAHHSLRWFLSSSFSWSGRSRSPVENIGSPT